ncbi:hypothetical protein [Kineococcus glutinatus]|uniref:LemA protein n=1 Tax=Kineococcus glutinatus TaxID=1070872 RepID=A0ABP9HGK5_9ACTN
METLNSAAGFVPLVALLLSAASIVISTVNVGRQLDRARDQALVARRVAAYGDALTALTAGMTALTSWAHGRSGGASADRLDELRTGTASALGQVASGRESIRLVGSQEALVTYRAAAREVSELERLFSQGMVGFDDEIWRSAHGRFAARREEFIAAARAEIR